MYFHVLLELDEVTSELQCVLADLSEAERKSRFLGPYGRGETLVCGGRVIETTRIRRVKVVRTEHRNAHELRVLRDQHRAWIDSNNPQAGSLTFLSLDRGKRLEELAESGADVTSKYVASAPAHSALARAVRLLNNNWLVAIIGGVILAAILAWVGLA
jgi:hypothetical protein